LTVSAREDELRHSPPPAAQYVPVDPASLGTVSATGLLATACTVLPGILVACAAWLTVRYRQALSRLRTLENTPDSRERRAPSNRVPTRETDTSQSSL